MHPWPTIDWILGRSKSSTCGCLSTVRTEQQINVRDEYRRTAYASVLWYRQLSVSKSIGAVKSQCWHTGSVLIRLHENILHVLQFRLFVPTANSSVSYCRKIQKGLTFWYCLISRLSLKLAIKPLNKCGSVEYGFDAVGWVTRRASGRRKISQ